MLAKQGFNEFKRGNIYDLIVTIQTKQEDILEKMLDLVQSGVLQPKDVPMALDENLTKMYDDIWVLHHLDEEDIFNEFYAHKCPFNLRYIENRETSWKRLAKKISTAR